MAARRKLRNEDGTYRRDHLRAFAQRVEVVDPTEIRIMGSKTELLRTLVAAAGVESTAAGVRSFIPKWRPSADETDNYVSAGGTLIFRPKTRLDIRKYPRPAKSATIAHRLNTEKFIQ